MKADGKNRKIDHNRSRIRSRLCVLGKPWEMCRKGQRNSETLQLQPLPVTTGPGLNIVVVWKEREKAMEQNPCRKEDSGFF
jgi:hypothetical protein